MTSINAYLAFNGNCEQAFNFYNAIFGAGPLTFSRYKEFQTEEFDAGSAGEKIHRWHQF